MTVYVVSCCLWNDIIGIFSSEHLAKRFVREHEEEALYLKKVELDVEL